MKTLKVGEDKSGTSLWSNQVRKASSAAVLISAETSNYFRRSKVAKEKDRRSILNISYGGYH